MKNLLPDKLRIDQLEELEKQKRVIYFNYLGNLDKFSKTPEEVLLKVLQGKNNAFVDNDLYGKEGNFTYSVQIKDWKESEEYSKYESLLQRMRFNR